MFKSKLDLKFIQIYLVLDSFFDEKVGGVGIYFVRYVLVYKII